MILGKSPIKSLCTCIQPPLAPHHYKQMETDFLNKWACECVFQFLLDGVCLFGGCSFDYTILMLFCRLFIIAIVDENTQWLTEFLEICLLYVQHLDGNIHNEWWHESGFHLRDYIEFFFFKCLQYKKNSVSSYQINCLLMRDLLRKPNIKVFWNCTFWCHMTRFSAPIQTHQQEKQGSGTAGLRCRWELFLVSQLLIYMCNVVMNDMIMNDSFLARLVANCVFDELHAFL